MDTKTKVKFIGLGAMGRGAAANLLAKGFDVVGCGSGPSGVMARLSNGSCQRASGTGSPGQDQSFECAVEIAS